MKQLNSYILFSLLISFTAASATSPSMEVPEIISVEQHAKQLSSLKMVGQDGEPFQLSDFEGQPVLINFMFSHCATACPMQTAHLKAIQNKLANTNLNYQFVSVSLTPKKDTPEKLSAFAKRFAVDESRWRFATGDVEQIEKLKLSLGVRTKDTDSDQLDHEIKYLLLDHTGSFSTGYNGVKLNPDRVFSDIQQLNYLARL
ncbi:SCO family protein [Enterovibrio sp. ZSDZ42]|uniref:SCO family protein n=1 Tax=Enterovibrio gelatinilyticus TaxID=2899819 RepID=A0ABT5R7Z7_9GAMM|nr:SCO family protein [Enterovibrio sp. ZSDZ42]MDD1796383.1 SCO family protein [Enterovibrio sp. ZSDZ42]